MFASGLAKIGLGLAAFGAGSAFGHLANAGSAILSMFGVESPFQQIMSIAEKSDELTKEELRSMDKATFKDIDKEKVEKMRNGVVPIYEPHLDVLFDRNIKADRLQFTTSLDEGLEHGKIIFLALPTPEDEDGSADLSYILGVAEHLGKIITDFGKDHFPKNHLINLILRLL